ncbi:hypothetical protein QFZ82_005472 [Streptomyces sp. V4I23]|uniref:hypothetical protein n=1 Tax=Streptomyces sp. V4I23 TaxID=3042282 RepID=UPI0027880E61|nr:hypothetical protein [Streptomyces sp. V4I23]MDQ1010987.1 hypothetical protein [Streptomyces sp. V4I23]
MSTRKRVRAALAGLAAAVSLTACGIQESDVIEAGGPATVDVLPAREVRMLLFFYSPEGTLMPVSRYTGEAFGDSAVERTRPSTAKTVAALLNGPNAEEDGYGLRSAVALPALGSAPKVEPGRGTVVVTMAAPVRGLTGPARRQLVCTIAYAEDAEGQTAVTLRGVDGTLDQARCDAGSGPVPTDVPRRADPEPEKDPWGSVRRSTPAGETPAATSSDAPPRAPRP